MSRRKTVFDQHHILFQRRHWDMGYAKLLRQAFIRPLPMRVHQQLHHDALRDVPLPSEPALKSLWEYYQEDSERVDEMGFGGACDWLVRHAPNKEFQDAIIKQRAFTIKNGIV